MYEGDDFGAFSARIRICFPKLLVRKVRNSNPSATVLRVIGYYAIGSSRLCSHEGINVIVFWIELITSMYSIFVSQVILFQMQAQP